MNANTTLNDFELNTEEKEYFFKELLASSYEAQGLFSNFFINTSLKVNLTKSSYLLLDELENYRKEFLKDRNRIEKEQSIMLETLLNIAIYCLHRSTFFSSLYVDYIESKPTPYHKRFLFTFYVCSYIYLMKICLVNGLDAYSIAASQSGNVTFRNKSISFASILNRGDGTFNQLAKRGEKIYNTLSNLFESLKGPFNPNWFKSDFGIDDLPNLDSFWAKLEETSSTSIDLVTLEEHNNKLRDLFNNNSLLNVIRDSSSDVTTDGKSRSNDDEETKKWFEYFKELNSIIPSDFGNIMKCFSADYFISGQNICKSLRDKIHKTMVKNFDFNTLNSEQLIQNTIYPLPGGNTRTSRHVPAPIVISAFKPSADMDSRPNEVCCVDNIDFIVISDLIRVNCDNKLKKVEGPIKKTINRVESLSFGMSKIITILVGTNQYWKASAGFDTTVNYDKLKNNIDYILNQKFNLAQNEKFNNFDVSAYDKSFIHYSLQKAMVYRSISSALNKDGVKKIAEDICNDIKRNHGLIRTIEEHMLIKLAIEKLKGILFKYNFYPLEDAFSKSLALDDLELNRVLEQKEADVGESSNDGKFAYIEKIYKSPLLTIEAKLIEIILETNRKLLEEQDVLIQSVKEKLTDPEENKKSDSNDISEMVENQAENGRTQI